jgi:hypothetical protein
MSISFSSREGVVISKTDKGAVLLRIQRSVLLSQAGLRTWEPGNNLRQVRLNIINNSAWRMTSSPWVTSRSECEGLRKLFFGDLLLRQQLERLGARDRIGKESQGMKEGRASLHYLPDCTITSGPPSFIPPTLKSKAGLKMQESEPSIKDSVEIFTK